jgi:alpha-beta hydrolase superfamily lysophospholipase
MDDELLDAQVLRTIGVAPYEGADIGECLAAARRVKGRALVSWYDEWSGLARRTSDLADVEVAAGRSESARQACFRAASYFRTAGVMLMGAPPDSRLVASNVAQTEAFRRGAALLADPPEVLSIPFGHTTLPGYFFRAAGEGRRATLILLGGYDGTAEELWFLNGAAAVARGYHVVAFDGPGQGAALLQQGLTLRPDVDRVVSAVFDHVAGRDDVDSARVGLIGLSLGGLLAPLAAAKQHRLAACVCDCGTFDLLQSAIDRLPGRLRGGLDPERRLSSIVLGLLLRIVARQPTAGWALRRGQLVHGATSPIGYLRSLKGFSLAGVAADITCPTLVAYAEDDDLSATAPLLFDALTCQKELLRFTAAEGAGDHCEAGGRLLFHARTFAWLDPILRPRD